MNPVRLLYYLTFVLIELVAVLGALVGIVFLFLPFVVVKAIVVLVARLFVRKSDSEPAMEPDRSRHTGGL
jgi:hypothetical protein